MFLPLVQVESLGIVLCTVTALPAKSRAEFTKECLASDVGFHVTGHDVAEVLRYLFLVHGCPVSIRSDNGPEFIAEAVKEFLAFSRVDTLYIEPGSPWENG